MRLATIRAFSFRASGAIEAWCVTRKISDPSIDAFCEGLRDLATSVDLPRWDKEINLLELTGMGDQIPNSVAHKLGPELRQFNEMICYAREISASQMYGAENLSEVLDFYSRTCQIAGIDPTLPAVFTESVGDDCWGEIISDTLRKKWDEANKSVNPTADRL